MLAGSALGLLIGALDGAVISVSMPRIAQDLGGGTFYAWAASAYLCGSTIGAPVWGAVADRLGARFVLSLGMIGFALSTLLCGIAGATSFGLAELALYRTAQGVASAAIFTGFFTLIAQLFPVRDRARHLGTFSLVFALASLAGPVAGGLLTDADGILLFGLRLDGWRFIFIAQLPLLIFGASLMGAPQIQSHERADRFDYIGTLLFAALVAFAACAATSESALGAIGFAGAAGGAALGLVLQERRAASAALFSPRLLASATIRNGCLASALSTAALLCLTVGLPLHLQASGQASASQAGLAISVIAIGVAIGALASGQYVSRTGQYIAILRLAPLAAMLGALALSAMSVSSLRSIWPHLFLIGLAFGPQQNLFSIAIQDGAPDDGRGQASGLIALSRRAGATLGAFAAGLAGSYLLDDSGFVDGPNFLMRLSVIVAALLVGVFLFAVAIPSSPQPWTSDSQGEVC